MKAMKDTIVVTGGSGFLGVEICRLAGIREVNIISILLTESPMILMIMNTRI